ncbi:MAG: cupin domain-containing protein, partial [Thiohalomonadales bacterium]
ERFRFIPNWRVDDIMMSYAPENGSVGPHTDNYDVFLLQAQGRRRWQISTLEYKDDDFIPDLELKILNSFKAQQTWILEPGDMLYLPPGVAHHGIALDECITISVGFRAPNLVELSTALLDHGLAASSTNLTQQFYQDPDLPLQENPGEITRQSLERISKILSQELLAQLRQADWFGQYITDTPTVEPPEPRDPPIDREECLRLTTIYPIVRNEIYKLAFFQGEHDRIHFYCNGNVEIHSKKIKPIIALICNNRSFSFSLLKDTLKNQASQVFFCDLINQGYLLFAEEVFAEQDECDVQKLDEDRGHE